MTAGRQLHYSYEEYLALEERSAVGHEYWNGEIYSMAGGTPDHASLAAALQLRSARVPPRAASERPSPGR